MGMDVVERVHDEVRVDLVPQVVQLLLEALLLELGQVFLLFLTLETVFHAQVGTNHHDDNEKDRDVVLVHRWMALGRAWRRHFTFSG